jgi:hypothetical protein
MNSFNAKTQRDRAAAKPFWTAAGSEAPCRFGSCDRSPKAVSPLRSATAIQNLRGTKRGWEMALRRDESAKIINKGISLHLCIIVPRR